MSYQYVDEQGEAPLVVAVDADGKDVAKCLQQHMPAIVEFVSKGNSASYLYLDADKAIEKVPPLAQNISDHKPITSRQKIQHLEESLLHHNL